MVTCYMIVHPGLGRRCTDIGLITSL
jgi:hypothetical protein